MAHEEHTPSPRCGNSSGSAGGGKSSKKLKHNKVPQRGMGVAQLEKIIEERQMKDVAVLTPSSTNFRSPSIPLPPPLPPNHHPLISESDSMNPNFVSKPMRTNSGGSNNWNGLHNFERENPNSKSNTNPNQNHHGYLMAMPTNLSGFTYESNPSIWPRVPTITQRSHFQQPCSSSMVNVPLGTTSSASASSSVMHLQIEPPSIQSYSSNKYTTFWQEEDKMVGKKRPYPFSVENLPIPSFNCKFPSYVSPVLKSDELTFCGSGSTGSLELHTPVSRENPLGLGSIRDQKTGKLIEDHHSLTKDFLTLGPSRSHSSSKKKLPPLSIGESTIPSYQGQMRDSPRTEWSNQQPLHSFFPAAKTLGNNNGEAEEHVDLNLKL